MGLGGSKPEAVTQEQITWAKSHKLDVAPDLRSRYLPLVDDFRVGSEAKMCWIPCNFRGIMYWHYFITNGVTIFEFGGGELMDNVVQVHRGRPPPHVFVEKTFTISREHQERMREVVGATNYSLCLRNCEHVARYVYSGSWVCMQMMGDGTLAKAFVRHMMGEVKRMQNLLPDDLRREHEVVELYPGIPGLITPTNLKKPCLDAADDRNFNIVFIGPTGSGKSSIINRLFNRTVCDTGDSAESVTREIRVYEGDADVMYAGGGVGRRRVNVIDTIGMCDSSLKASDVVRLIQDWLKVQGTTIDCFVVVVSSRIEAGHSESIKQMMEWLQFKKFVSNFIFIYNKADTLRDDAARERNVSIMVDKLETGFTTIRFHQHESLPLNFAMGIPDGASAQQSQEGMRDFATVLFGSRPIRVPVNVSSCSIL